MIEDKIFIFKIEDKIYCTAQPTQFDAETMFDIEISQDHATMAYSVSEGYIDSLPEDVIWF